MKRIKITLIIFFGIIQLGNSQSNIRPSIGIHSQYSYYNSNTYGFGFNVSAYTFRKRNQKTKYDHILTYNYTLSYETKNNQAFHEHFLEYSLWTKKYFLNPLVGFKSINKRGNSPMFLAATGVSIMNFVNFQYSYLLTDNDSKDFMSKHNFSIMLRLSFYQLDLIFG